jgi:hypothetical protein
MLLNAGVPPHTAASEVWPATVMQTQRHREADRSRPSLLRAKQVSKTNLVLRILMTTYVYVFSVDFSFHVVSVPVLE